MGSLAELSDFKRKIDLEIKAFLDKTIKETARRDALMADALRYVKKLVLAGGKRLRPAFMYYGYLAAGGREKEEILKTAISVELIHIFLLIHDDIIDRDNLRHGIDTVEVRYKKLGKKFFRKIDYVHFGSAMAIIIGDMVGALGNQVIFDSNFKPELIMQALSRLQGIISMTVIGQSQDIYIENKKKASEKEILRMYENKTAKYTIEGPLHLGAILGGAEEKLLRSLSSYALPIGIAFQIQDDILGVFGNEKKMGKPVGADIKQGKYTILVAKAFEKADKKQKVALERLLGKKDLSSQDIEEFLTIIRKTGAYDYAKKMSYALSINAKRELTKLKINPEAKKFLNDVAEYMIEREL